MELAISALASLFGGGGATAATAVAGTAATAASTTSTLATVGQVVTGLLAAVGTIGAGQAAARQSEQLAMEADLQSGQVGVEAQQRQTEIKRALLQTLGENDVTYAAAGIDISSGIAQSNAAEAKKRAATEISIDRSDTEFQQAMYKLKADNYRRQASSEKTAGLLGAVGQIAGIKLSA